MKSTGKNLYLNKPEGTDRVNIDDLNQNSDIINENASNTDAAIKDLKYTKADITNPIFFKGAKIRRKIIDENDETIYAPADENAEVMIRQDLNEALEVKNLDA